jgi:hypothetical protein
MIPLSPRAQHRLDQYLDAMRISLRGCPSIDPREIERDILDHIDHELRDRSLPTPIEEAELGAVLHQLGSPDQWVPQEDIPLWRRLVLTFRHGPEDWRLAYLSLGAFLITVFCLTAGRLPFLIASGVGFLFARAAVETGEDRQGIGPQRWLIYPSLLLVYLPLAILTIVGPAILSANLASQAWIHSDFTFRQTTPEWPFVLSVGGLVGGMWWLALGLILKLAPGIPKHVFYPIMQRSGQRGIHALVVAGASAGAVCATTVLYVLR